MSFIEACDDYIRRMRSEKKRAYAWHYSRWRFDLQYGADKPEPPARDANLSYMAAQGVRLQIGEIEREHYPELSGKR